MLYMHSVGEFIDALEHTPGRTGVCSVYYKRKYYTTDVGIYFIIEVFKIMREHDIINSDIFFKTSVNTTTSLQGVTILNLNSSNNSVESTQCSSSSHRELTIVDFWNK